MPSLSDRAGPLCDYNRPGAGKVPRAGNHLSAKATEAMPEISPSKYLVQAGVDDVPHLSEKTKAEMWASTPPHLRKARFEGVPGLGAGAIYPVDLEDILEDSFQIPPHWPRCYSLDPGWNITAVLWGALEREADCWHFYTEHYRGQAEPPSHVAAIKARGEWIPGLIDPSAGGSNIKDGSQLMAEYTDLGLNLTPANNAVEAGIYAVWTRLVTGRIKIWRPLRKLQAEYNLYRRDEKGKVVKENDHLLDDLRYIVLSGAQIAIPVPATEHGLNIIGSSSRGDPAVGV